MSAPHVCMPGCAQHPPLLQVFPYAAWRAPEDRRPRCPACHALLVTGWCVACRWSNGVDGVDERHLARVDAAAWWRAYRDAAQGATSYTVAARLLILAQSHGGPVPWCPADVASTGTGDRVERARLRARQCAHDAALCLAEGDDGQATGLLDAAREHLAEAIKVQAARDARQ